MGSAASSATMRIGDIPEDASLGEAGIYFINEENNQTFRVAEESRRRICLKVLSQHPLAQKILDEAPIERRNYKDHISFERAQTAVKDIRELIIHIFGSISKAKKEYEDCVAKDFYCPVDLDDIYDEYDYDQDVQEDTFHIELWRELETTSHGPYIERLTTGEITTKFIKEAADHHRLIFGNTMHFVKCNDCGERRTAKEIFGLLERDELVPLEQMDNANNTFMCPCCSGKMERIHDPAVTYKIFAEKLIGSETVKSFVSVLRRADDSIAGMAFAYVTSVDRERKLEWDNDGDPYMSGYQENKNESEIKAKFLQCVNDEVFPDYGPIKDNKNVIAWNHISVSPDMTGSMLELTYDLFAQIPKGMRSMLVLGDVKRGSVAHRFFRKLGGKDGTSFFGKNSDNILIGGRAADAIEYLKTIHD